MKSVELGTTGEYVKTYNAASTPKCTYTTNATERGDFPCAAENEECDFGGIFSEQLVDIVAGERLGSNPNQVPPRG